MLIRQPENLDVTVWHELGHGHAYKFLTWSPDFSIAGNAHWTHLVHLIKTMPVVGAIVRHRCQTPTGLHEGAIEFRTELTTAAWDGKRGFNPANLWDVQSWQPLTVSPSLLSHCPCKDHGFIRDGRWVRA